MNNFSKLFEPVSIKDFYNKSINSLTSSDCSSEALEIKNSFLTGDTVLWGMPFNLGKKEGQNNIIVLKDSPVKLEFSKPLKYKYLVFLHTADYKKSIPGEDGIFRPMLGNPRLGETVAEYILQYDDNTEYTIPVKRRFNIHEFSAFWGEISFECVPHIKPGLRPNENGDFIRDQIADSSFGYSQIKFHQPGFYGISNHWLYAFENPYPKKEIKSIVLIPKDGTTFFFGLTGGNINSNPLRWERRKKIKLTLPKENKDDIFNYENIDIDLGQIISVKSVLDYDNKNWTKNYNNKQPISTEKSVVVNYTAHPDASIYLGKENKTIIPLSGIDENEKCVNEFMFCSVAPAEKRVTVKVLDKKTQKPATVKIHIHSEFGEYNAPMDRRPYPNLIWSEDSGPDYANGRHFCTYIDGQAEFKLPLGKVYIEISKGLEIAPIHKCFEIDENTKNITIEIEHVLNWREKGWVTADTHVHFLSRHTALLEGEGEGINVVNLLATQWGEWFSNVADFDGKTILGSKETGGSGEYLVSVGTENRQHILGHISLLGYEGRIILPLTTGGSDESAIGDAVEETLTGWAKRCHKQKGIVIYPHSPYPAAEAAATIVSGEIDGVEMTSWGDLYGGISPYSLSNWYKFLNCDYHVAAVGGTDKMGTDTAVGTVRTYVRIKDKPFTYDNWKEAVKSGLTFVTYGPLMEFTVNGQDMGTKIFLKAGGGILNIDWEISSVTIPVTKVELVVSGETKEVLELNPSQKNYRGHFDIKMKESGWLALRVRGCYPDKPEVITAHSSAVMVYVDGKRCFNSLDAMTILEQIEGTTAYIKNLGTKAEEKAYKKLLMTITSAHRQLHNRMHQSGIYHNHTVVDEHHKK